MYVRIYFRGGSHQVHADLPSGAWRPGVPRLRVEEAQENRGKLSHHIACLLDPSGVTRPDGTVCRVFRSELVDPMSHMSVGINQGL